MSLFLIKETGTDTATNTSVQQTESKAKITIPIQEISWELKPGMNVPVWTYKGTIPGKEIRVKEGKWVEVEFTNHLPESTSIHWHGYPVPAEMDGIPGITMSAIKPGESYTYRFHQCQERTGIIPIKTASNKLIKGFTVHSL